MYSVADIKDIFMLVAVLLVIFLPLVIFLSHQNCEEERVRRNGNLANRIKNMKEITLCT